MTPITFTDQELSILNDIVRQNKISLTQEDLVMLVSGKKTSPITDLTVKIAQAWDIRQQEIKQNIETKQ